MKTIRTGAVRVRWKRDSLESIALIVGPTLGGMFLGTALFPASLWASMAGATVGFIAGLARYQELTTGSRHAE